MKPAALFDVDKTLVNVNTVRLYVRWRMGRREAGLRVEIVDEEPVPAVGRHPSRRRVRLDQVALTLEDGHVVAHRGARHPEAVPVDERLAPDRLCRRDVFLDDGPKDRLRAEVQRAEWATDSTRQTRSPVALALDGVEC